MNTAEREAEARRIEAYFDRLWPILRSLTGPGVRESHDILAELVPLRRHEFATGSEVLDWVVPDEWRVREAFVVTPDGRRILDVQANNLHLLNYSIPFTGTVSRTELDRHLYSDPARPAAIPYRTSYYKRAWGFCISEDMRRALPDGDYRVHIDSELVSGSLTLSEATLPGESARQVMFTTYTCHPSLAINELSGPLLTAFLYQRLARWPRRRLSYRFVFGPETLGAICFLAKYGEELLESLEAGFITTCVGDAGDYTLKYSKRGDTAADRAASYVLDGLGTPYRTQAFHPSGSDERQYCSLGYNLPVASVMRTTYGDYPQYHTSDDDKTLMDFRAMTRTLDTYEAIARALEANRLPRNRVRFGEPQFSRRGDLYPTIGERMPGQAALAVKWLIHYADGEHDLLSIARASGLDLELLHDVACRAVDSEIFEWVDERSSVVLNTERERGAR